MTGVILAELGVWAFSLAVLWVREFIMKAAFEVIGVEPGCIWGDEGLVELFLG